MFRSAKGARFGPRRGVWRANPDWAHFANRDFGSGDHTEANAYYVAASGWHFLRTLRRNAGFFSAKVGRTERGQLLRATAR
jgi:hypothetical protein